MKATRAAAASVSCLTALFCAVGCGDSPTDPDIPSELARIGVALTETLESPSFVFHHSPGDTVQVERSEAYHRWAIGYLGVNPPKKIDFYKYRTPGEMASAFGYQFGGMAFPEEFAVATAYSWHNHECMHLYVTLIGMPPRLFGEGMVVAHEFDPFNQVWVSQWNRAEPPEDPYIDIVRRLHSQGLLYPMEEIIESDAFDSATASEAQRIAYPQSGVWVMYLIERYGLESMKQIVRSMPYDAQLRDIQELFQEVYGVSIVQAEEAWHDWLEMGR